MSLPAWPKFTAEEWREEVRTLGGPGSGNFGHAGRPGEVGGSAPESNAALLEQREAGIAAVGKLLERAVAEAKYNQEAAEEWDDLTSDVQQLVKNQWIGTELEDGINVDRTDIENEIINDIRRDNDEIIGATEEEVTVALGELGTLEDGHADWPEQPTLQGEEFKLVTRQIDWETVEVDEDDGEGAKIVNLDDVRTTDGYLLTGNEKDILQEQWDRYYEKEIDKAVEEALTSDSYYEQVSQLEQEVAYERWNDLSDEQKLDYAVEQNFTRSQIVAASEPDNWVTGMKAGESTTDDDYAKTRAIANKLAELRTAQLYDERKIGEIISNRYVAEKADGFNDYYVKDTYDAQVLKSFATKEAADKHALNLNANFDASAPDPDTLIRDTWDQWKNSSSNDASKTFQLAAAEELGGYHRISEEEQKRLISDTSPAEYQALKAYARAQWETTQYVMRRAGIEDVEVYRGLMLDNDLVSSTKQEPFQKTATGYRKLTPTIEFNEPGESLASVRLKSDDPQEQTGLTPWANYQVYVNTKLENFTDPSKTIRRSDAEILAEGTKRLNELFWGENPGAKMRLPDLALQRSGLQSTTTNASVANQWNGIGHMMPFNPTRVVLRANAPATSVLSIPVFGQNIKEEQEVVLIGTRDRWEWDAWRGTAPTFQQYPVRRPRPRPQAAPMRAAAKKLVIDLYKEDEGRPHWLNPIARAIGNRWWKRHQMRAAQLKASYKYSTIQVQLNAGLVGFAKSIPEIDLAEKGIEDDEHITIKYGLHTIDPNDVVNALNSFVGPIRLTLGVTSFFDTEDGDALVVLVDSPDLHKLNALISEKLECKPSDYVDYIPHATIAYLKPGIGKDYADDARFAGMEFEVNTITFSSKDGKRSTLQLGIRAAGGPGSGNFGHAGRPGEVGGSAERNEFGLLSNTGQRVEGGDWHVSPTGEEAFDMELLRQRDKTPFVMPVVKHKEVRADGGWWGYSHSNSRGITGAAATQMGLPGYEFNEEHFDPKVKKIADRFLTEISGDQFGAPENLYHSFENVRNTEFKVGDTMRLPLTATSGGRYGSYGIRLDAENQRGQPIVFVFDKGTQMMGYSGGMRSKHRLENAGYESNEQMFRESGTIWDEAIVAGGFEITSVTDRYMGSQHSTREMRDNPNAKDKIIQIYGKVVRLKQIETYDPQKGWSSRG